MADHARIALDVGDRQYPTHCWMTEGLNFWKIQVDLYHVPLGLNVRSEYHENFTFAEAFQGLELTRLVRQANAQSILMRKCNIIVKNIDVQVLYASAKIYRS